MAAETGTGIGTGVGVGGSAGAAGCGTSFSVVVDGVGAVFLEGFEKSRAVTDAPVAAEAAARMISVVLDMSE